MPILEAPESGVTVRMYRQGHGDCFLLAFRDDDGEPFYMLIDCGYKPGSQVHHKIQEVVDDIAESTGGHIHIVLITHEHQDHVNGFWNRFGATEKEYFRDIRIDHLWVAWTEDPNDDFANKLRQKYNDTLLGLIAAGRHLANAPGESDREVGRRVMRLLDFEVEGDLDTFMELAIEGVTNKKAIQFIQQKTARRPLYLRPSHRPYWLPKVSGVRIFALGPPRNEELLLSLDPIGSEEYHLALAGQTDSFLAAAASHADDERIVHRASREAEAHQPFAARHRIAEDRVAKSPFAEFFRVRYGWESEDDSEAWRRIDQDWLRSAESLALRLNSEVNNTSAVIGVEMPRSRRVLLFVGDAQRGNWMSWRELKWTSQNGLAAGEEIDAKDLLARTVLYKVGHHGSHNATLKGAADSDYPNLEWMAQGDYREQFVAMIPANEVWANAEAHWKHPLPSIRQALVAKAKGRVFQTNLDEVARHPGITDAEWQEFRNRTVETSMYLQYTVPD